MRVKFKVEANKTKIQKIAKKRDTVMDNLKDLNLENNISRDDLRYGSKRAWKKSKGPKESKDEMNEL